jgi:hypothetical protein
LHTLAPLIGGSQHPDGDHVLFDSWRRGLALKCLDVRGHRDGFNVFQVLVTDTLSPSQKLENCPVISGSGVRIADRNRKKLEEFLRVFGPARVMMVEVAKDCRESLLSPPVRSPFLLPPARR